MKRGPLAWVHLTENRFTLAEQKNGGFLVVPTYFHEQEKIGGEIFRTRSDGIYWRDKFSVIYKAGFIAGMDYIIKHPDKNQTDLFNPTPPIKEEKINGN